MDQPNTSGNDLVSAQENYENRFSCPVCLDPRLKMVVSICQHRICSDCLYDTDGNLQKAMDKCPTCQQENAFPQKRPDIPEDNIELQRQLGVTECPMDGCQAGLWIWDVEKHIESCPHAVVSPKPGSKRSQRQVHQLEKENTKTSLRVKRQKKSPARQREESACSQSAQNISRARTRVQSAQFSRSHNYQLRNTPQQSTPQQSTPQQSTPQQSTPQQSTPQQSTPQQSTPQQSTPQQSTPQQSTPQQSTPHQNYPHQNYPHQNYPHQNYPHQNYPQQNYPQGLLPEPGCSGPFHNPYNQFNTSFCDQAPPFMQNQPYYPRQMAYPVFYRD